MTRLISLPIPVQPRRAARLIDAAVGSMRSFAWSTAFVLAGIAFLHLVSITSWPFELLHHFLMPYALVAGGLATAAFCFRAKRLALVAGTLTLFFAGAYARSADFFAGGETAGVSISLITNNVYCRNWDTAGLRSWLATRPADIVALQEVPPHVEQVLAPLLSAGTYPYSARIPAGRSLSRNKSKGCEGILLLSTVPIVSASIYRPNEKAWPSLLTQLQVPDAGPVWLVLVHASDPVRPEGLLWRDEFLASYAPIIASLRGPVLVAGDFNATPFTPAFRRFLEEANMLPPRTLAGSYPANIGAFGLPIDHILSRDADVVTAGALPAIGSDHRPIFARIVLPAENAEQ